MPRVGDPAPAFVRTAHDGRRIQVGFQPRERALVLYFYPADNTLGCTVEACSFRDSYAGFGELGAEVVGVSPDNAATHEAFAAKHHLPYALISDTDGALRRLYGVRTSFGFIPGRVTFVIDHSNAIRHVFNSQLRARTHVREALQIVRQLQHRR
jgi:peroxiredoxin Q/BCP